MYLQLDDISVPGGDDGSVVALKALIDAVCNGHVKSATVQAGGSGYAVGDIVEIDTGTPIGTFRARFMVLAEASGVVTQVVLRSGGVYSTLPNESTSGHATTALTGSGDDALTLNIVVEGPFEAVPAVAGSSYVVGDVITVTGGSGGSTDPTFVVTGVSGGAVTTLAPLALGDRTTPVDTTITPATTTGGTGSGLTVEYNQVGWRLMMSTYSDGTTDFEAWVKGTNSAGAHPYCGIRTVTGANQYLELAMGDTFNPLATFFTQTGGWTDNGGNQRLYIGATASASFSWFIYVSGRVINFVLSDDNSYELGVIGCFIPFTDNPSGTFPKPFVAGGTLCSAGNQTIASPWTLSGSDTRVQHSSIMHPMNDDFSGSNTPPYRVTNAIGQWTTFTGQGVGGYDLWPFAGINALAADQLAPELGGGGSTQPSSPVSNIGLSEASGGGWFNEESTAAGTPGVSPLGPSGQMHFMVPPVIISDITGDGAKIHGQLEGLAAINGRGLNDEDRVTDTEGRRWVVLPDTVTNSIRARFALLEG